MHYSFISESEYDASLHDISFLEILLQNYYNNSGYIQQSYMQYLLHEIINTEQ